MAAMETAELHARLLDDAQRYDPSAHARCALQPYRDVLLLWRVKAMSYERIAATLTSHGLRTSPTAVGVFCRHYCPESAVARERKRIEDEKAGRPAATAPSFEGLSAAATPGAGPELPRKRGKIARDNYLACRCGDPQWRQLQGPALSLPGVHRSDDIESNWEVLDWPQSGLWLRLRMGHPPRSPLHRRSRTGYPIGLSGFPVGTHPLPIIGL